MVTQHPIYQTVMASHTHDRNTHLNRSSDVNVPLGRTHSMRRSFIYIERGAIVWILGSLSAFKINLKHY